ncbi:hypothetical protein D3C81_218380 [compost metagenome]
MMRVFVTGATGFVGSAIVRELIEAGHEVLGLARSNESAATLAAEGAAVHSGSLEDLDSLKRGTEAADGVIHTAFSHNFSDLTTVGEQDRLAIETLGAALAGTDRPLVVTSVMGHLAQGRLATEEDAPDTGSAAAHRIASEEAALSLASRGVRVSVMRLPLSVHGEGDRGFVPALIQIARSKGAAAYIGDGANRWPAVHRLDAARLYRLALEAALAGTILHATAEEGVPIRDIATVIGARLGVPVVSKTPKEAAEHFGWLAHFVTADITASSALTRNRFGWDPVQPGLISDLDREHYFSINK